MARARGFSRAAVVDPSLLPGPSRPLPADFEQNWVLDPVSWSLDRSILACCLACASDGPGDLSGPGEPHARVAPFARAAFYHAAAQRLGSLADELSAAHGLRRRSFRALSNSRLPEKSLLAASGLAGTGKNSLCIVPGLGSLFVIALLVMPVPTAAVLEAPAAPAADPCGSCDRCARACPTDALHERGVVDTRLCLQAFAAHAGPVPAVVRDAWGTRLYGCQSCQDCCPHNRRVPASPLPGEGTVGPSIAIRGLLRMRAEERHALLHRSAMGMRWVDERAILRNALLAAGHAGDAALRDVIALHADHEEQGVREAARWALGRLSAPVGARGDEGEHHEHGDEHVEQQRPE